MKLGDHVAPGKIGELEERARLARNAREAAERDRQERAERLRRALAGQASPDVSFAADRILEIVEREPWAYLPPTALRELEPEKPPAKIAKTAGMSRNTVETIALHMLAVDRLGRLLSDEDRSNEAVAAALEAASAATVALELVQGP